MAVINDTQYAYAAGRISVIEKKLLDRSKIDRMVEAKTPEDALKVLLEAGYGYSAEDITNVTEYEILLKEELQKVYELLGEIAPQPWIFDMFLQRNDYHNLKVLLKAEFLDQDSDYLLIDAGMIPASELKVLINERNFLDMPEVMKNAVEECLDAYNRTGDPQMIDLILDRASFLHMRKIAKDSDIPFVIELVETMIDLENIKIFLRVKVLKKSWDFLKKVLLPGGSIESEKFIEKLDSSLDSFLEVFKVTPYASVCEEGIADYQNTGSLSKLEKLADNYIIDYLKKTKYIFLGIQPLVAYLMAKENEIKMIRIVMVGKINKLPNEIIRERLREAYV